MTEELQNRHERLLQFLYLAPTGILEVAPDGSVSMLNAVATQLLMPLTGGLAPTNLWALLFPLSDALQRAVSTSADRTPICRQLRVHLGASTAPPDGRILAVDVQAVTPERWMVSLTDVTTTVRQAIELDRRDRQLRTIFDNIRDYALFTTDVDGRIREWNRSGERLFGIATDDAVGRTPDALWGSAWPTARLLPAAIANGWAEYEGWFERAGGERFWGEGVITVLDDAEGGARGFSVITRDQTERKGILDRLSRMANSDQLTGIANRRRFYEVAGEAFSARGDQGLGVLLLDADHFKAVNDTHGHAAGDAVLVALAETVRGVLRGDDLVARFGGEEFVVLVTCDSIGALVEVAERVRASVEARTVVHDGVEVGVTVSVGAAFAGPDHADVDALIGAADEAAYRAKAGGRNRVEVSGASAAGPPAGEPRTRQGS